MAVNVESRRVCILAGDRESDVAIPAGVPIRELLPLLMDMVMVRAGGRAAGWADRQVGLCHPLSGFLDPGRSAADCGIRDGDLLILAPLSAPAPQPRFDPCAAVSDTVDSLREARSGVPLRAVAVVTVNWSATLAAVLLGRPLADPSAPRQVAVTAVGAAAVLVAAALFRHCRFAPPVVAGTICAASVLAAIAGALAVPGGPGVANLCLATAVYAVTAFGARQFLPCAATSVVTLGAASGTAAAVSLAAVLGAWPSACVGPLLAVAGLILLTAAPRVAARTARLTALEPGDPALAGATRTAHRRLDVTVAAASGTAALGGVFTALGTPPTSVSTAFVAAVAAALALSARSYDAPARTTGLLVGAGICATALSVAAVRADPSRAAAVCGLLGVLCAVVIGWAMVPAAAPPAAVRRLLSCAEILTTVAVVPLGCWAGGLFAAVRGLAVS